MSKHYVIYIPGLGDHRAKGQRLAVSLWRVYGVQGELFQIHWRDGQAFEPKLQRLVDRIDTLTSAGNSVSLVAASAGASAALSVYAARPETVSGVVLLCGKIHNAHQMHPSVFKKNISFEHSMSRLPQILDQLSISQRSRIMSVHPLADESVPVADTIIAGAVERTVPVVGHAVGIAYGLTIYAPIAMHFLKQQAKNLPTNKN